MPPTDGFHFVSGSTIDLLYDDNDRDVFTFSQSTSQPWTVFPDLQWLGGSATVLGGESTAGSGDEAEESLTVTYRGGGVSLYGLAPSATEGQRFRVSVNGQEPVEASFGGSWSSSSPSSSDSTTLPSSSNTTASLSYGVWYSVQTPETNASSPPTTVKFYNLPPGLSVDYARVTANGASQNISGPVLVDDTDGNITYTGSWTQTQEPFTLEGKSQVAEVSAYGGGVRVGRQVGDTVQLNFYGDSISVFGLFSQQASSGGGGGGMTVSYTVDLMQPQVRRYGSSSATPVTSTTGATTDNSSSTASALGMVSMQNYELFSSGVIAGDKFHSLLINITSIHSSSTAPENQQALVIDYFTYDPSMRTYDELWLWTSSTAHDSSKVTPKYAWVLIAVFVGLGLLLVFCSWLRVFLKRRPEIVRRLAETVRLDLEFSFNNARKFLRSTILDIRPQTPPPAPPSSGSAAQSSRNDGPSGEASAAGGQNPSNRQAQVQELWSIIAYLSRINARLLSAVNVGRSNTASTGSVGGQSWFGARSRGGMESEAPPPYAVV